MTYTNKHTRIFKKRTLALILGIMLFFTALALASNLHLFKIESAKSSTTNKLQPIHYFSQNLKSKSYSEINLYLQKQNDIILAKDLEINAKKDRILSLVSFLLLLTFLIIMTTLLAAFYWRRNIALDYQSSKIKDDLNYYLFGTNDEQGSESQEEFRKQKMLLNERQQEILDLMAFGLSNKQIAGKLFISENTVKYHIKNIYHLLHVKDRKTLWLSQS